MTSRRPLRLHGSSCVGAAAPVGDEKRPFSAAAVKGRKVANEMREAKEERAKGREKVEEASVRLGEREGGGAGAGERLLLLARQQVAKGVRVARR